MSYMGIDVADSEMRRNTQIILNGKVEELKALLHKTHSIALPIATINWEGQHQLINSYQLVCALYDTYAYNKDQKWFEEHNILEILNVHKRLLPSIPHVDYNKIAFITWNDDEYYDEDDTEILLKSGVRKCDIDLTNYGMQHKEKKVIELLRNGASPYFKDVTNEAHLEDGKSHWYYENLAPLLCCLDSVWCDQWDIHGLTLLRKDISLLDDEDLELIVFDLFNAAASQRILYLVDKYISDEAREKGEDLMRKYDAFHPILRRKPE